MQTGRQVYFLLICQFSFYLTTVTHPHSHLHQKGWVYQFIELILPITQYHASSIRRKACLRIYRIV